METEDVKVTAINMYKYKVIPHAVHLGESRCLAIQQERLLISPKTDIALKHMYSIILTV